MFIAMCVGWSIHDCVRTLILRGVCIHLFFPFRPIARVHSSRLINLLNVNMVVFESNLLYRKVSEADFSFRFGALCCAAPSHTSDVLLKFESA